MLRRYLGNPELLRYVAVQLLVGFAVAGLAALGMRASLHALDHDIASRAVAAAVSVSRVYPEAGAALARELAAAYGSRRAPPLPREDDGPMSAADLLIGSPGYLRWHATWGYLAWPPPCCS
jgi:hypothetical protein